MAAGAGAGGMRPQSGHTGGHQGLEWARPSLSPTAPAGSGPDSTMISDFWPPDLGDNSSFQSPRVWYFAVAATGHC